MQVIPNPGEQVGPYRLLEQVARGGQGVVYRAARAGSDAPVALKLLVDLDPESLDRFEREALALAKLAHPNVVRVHDYGRHGRQPYLVMEWIPGENLRDHVRARGPLAPEQAAELLEPVARALGQAHRLGVAHRDVKPQNLVLDPARGVILVDFGLVSRVAGHGGALAKRLTATGEILGTPAYMAPEQAEQSFGEVGPRSDVYALGATLYFLLTGVAPLDTRGGLTSVLLRLIEGEPPDPRAVRPEVPAGLAQLCLGCMARQPAERLPDGDAFADALAAAGQPGTGAGRGRTLGLTAGVVAVLLVGLGLARFGEPAPPSLASPPREAPPAPVTTLEAPRPVDLRDVRTSVSNATNARRWEAAIAAVESGLRVAPRDAWFLGQRAQARQHLAASDPGQLEVCYRDWCALLDVKPTPANVMAAAEVAQRLADRPGSKPPARHAWLLHAAESLKKGLKPVDVVDSPYAEVRLRLGRTYGELAEASVAAGDFQRADAELLSVLTYFGSFRPQAAQLACGAALRRRLVLGLSSQRAPALPSAELQARFELAHRFWQNTIRQLPKLHAAHASLAAVATIGARQGDRIGLSRARSLELFGQAEQEYWFARQLAVRRSVQGGYAIQVAKVRWLHSWAERKDLVSALQELHTEAFRARVARARDRKLLLDTYVRACRAVGRTKPSVVRALIDADLSNPSLWRLEGTQGYPAELREIRDRLSDD